MTVAEAPVREARLSPFPEPSSSPRPRSKPKDVLIIDYSGDLEKVWAMMILASTAARWASRPASS